MADARTPDGSVREKPSDLRQRLEHVERAVELCVSWQYQLRVRADEVRDLARVDRLDPLRAQLTQLEQEVDELRHVLQDLSQVLVAKRIVRPPARPVVPPAPPPPPRPSIPRVGESRALGPLPIAAARDVRALTSARWSVPSARGHELVDIHAIADGWPDGALAEVFVYLAGDDRPLATLEAPVRGGEVNVEWETPAIGAEALDLDFVVRLDGRRTVSDRLRVEPGEGRRRGARGRRETDHGDDAAAAGAVEPQQRPPAPELIESLGHALDSLSALAPADRGTDSEPALPSIEDLPPLDSEHASTSKYSRESVLRALARLGAQTAGAADEAPLDEDTPPDDLEAAGTSVRPSPLAEPQEPEVGEDNEEPEKP